MILAAQIDRYLLETIMQHNVYRPNQTAETPLHIYWNIQKHMTNKYDDIINLPHHVSMRHSHMTMTQRADQFAPFAALVGHDKAIEETARRNKRELRQATC